MLSSPVDSSIRSKHTGQVGNSIKAGVGGATGFEFNEADERDCSTVLVAVDVSGLGGEGVNGSLVMSGNEGPSLFAGGPCNSTDLTKTTWQFSGFKASGSARMV